MYRQVTSEASAPAASRIGLPAETTASYIQGSAHGRQCITRGAVMTLKIRVDKRKAYRISGDHNDNVKLAFMLKIVYL